MQRSPEDEVALQSLISIGLVKLVVLSIRRPDCCNGFVNAYFECKGIFRGQARRASQVPSSVSKGSTCPCCCQGSAARRGKPDRRPQPRKSFRQSGVTFNSEPQAVSRRAALGLLAGAAALVTKTGPSEAAFGDAANVFGRTTNKSGGGCATCSSSKKGLHEITVSQLDRLSLQVSYLTLERATHCCSRPNGTPLRNVRLAESSSGGSCHCS